MCLTRRCAPHQHILPCDVTGASRESLANRAAYRRLSRSRYPMLGATSRIMAATQIVSGNSLSSDKALQGDCCPTPSVPSCGAALIPAAANGTRKLQKIATNRRAKLQGARK